MPPGPDPQVNLQVVEQERRRLGQRLEEVSRLCEADVPPVVFYGELLKRLLESLAAPAGAVWTRTPQGNLQIQYQVNLQQIGLDQSDEVRQSHGELLRLAVAQGKPMDVPPRSGVGAAEEGKPSAGNTTDYLLLIVPILLNDQVDGLIEVWQQPNRPVAAVPGFLQYMHLMAELASRYQRRQMLRQMTGQEQLWTQLETFARQVHGSLKPLEVAFQVANDGRRLIECDRVSVAVRYGGRRVHRGRQRRRCRRETLQRRAPHAQALPARPALGREARLQRHARRQPAAPGAQGPGRLPGGKPEQAAWP